MPVRTVALLAAQAWRLWKGVLSLRDSDAFSSKQVRTNRLRRLVQSSRWRRLAALALGRMGQAVRTARRRNRHSFASPPAQPVRRRRPSLGDKLEFNRVMDQLEIGRASCRER